MGFLIILIKGCLYYDDVYLDKCFDFKVHKENLIVIQEDSKILIYNEKFEMKNKISIDTYGDIVFNDYLTVMNNDKVYVIDYNNSNLMKEYSNINYHQLIHQYRDTLIFKD